MSLWLWIMVQIINKYYMHKKYTNYTIWCIPVIYQNLFLAYVFNIKILMYSCCTFAFTFITNNKYTDETIINNLNIYLVIQEKLY